LSSKPLFELKDTVMSEKRNSSGSEGSDGVSPPKKPLMEDSVKYPGIDYFMNESVSDVLLLVDGHRIPVIRQELSLRSHVFRAMFCDHFKESKDKEIVIEETTVEAFKTMIFYLYTNQLQFADTTDLDLICDVYKLSETSKAICKA
jgi:hypothetical protein